MFGIRQIPFNSTQKYTLFYKCHNNVPVFIEVLDISHQKLSVITRKHHGRFTRRRIDGDSSITFFKIEDAESCVEELNAMLVSKELIK